MNPIERQVYFSFQFQNDPQKEFGFFLPSIDEDEENGFWDDMNKHIEKLDLETEYGVHDISGTSSDKTIGMGYTTNEVEDKKILEWMNGARFLWTVLGPEK